MAVFNVIHFWEKQYNLDQVNEFCISRHNAITKFPVWQTNVGL